MAGALLLVLGGLSGCRVPAEDSATQRLYNDLGVRVGLAPCEDDSCDRLGGSVRYHLDPGGSLPVNVSNEGVATWYRIDEPGEAPRCLKVVVNGIPRRSTVPLSQGIKCPPPSSRGLADVLEAIAIWCAMLVAAVIGPILTFAILCGAVGAVLAPFAVLFWLVRRVHRAGRFD